MQEEVERRVTRVTRVTKYFYCAEKIMKINVCSQRILKNDKKTKKQKNMLKM